MTVSPWLPPALKCDHGMHPTSFPFPILCIPWPVVFSYPPTALPTPCETLPTLNPCARASPPVNRPSETRSPRKKARERRTAIASACATLRPGSTLSRRPMASDPLRAPVHAARHTRQDTPHFLGRRRGLRVAPNQFPLPLMWEIASLQTTVLRDGNYRQPQLSTRR